MPYAAYMACDVVCGDCLASVSPCMCAADFPVAWCRASNLLVVTLTPSGMRYVLVVCACWASLPCCSYTPRLCLYFTPQVFLLKVNFSFLERCV